MTDGGPWIRPDLGVVTAGCPCRACDGRRCADANPRKSLAAGLVDLGAAAAVLVVGSDRADPSLQPDGVVVGADHLQFSAELVGGRGCVPGAATRPWRARRSARSGPGRRGCEGGRSAGRSSTVPGTPWSTRRSSGAVVGDRQQQRADGAVLGQVDAAVLAGATSSASPSASKASPNTTWTWVEGSSALSMIASHLRLTRSKPRAGRAAAR